MKTQRILALIISLLFVPMTVRAEDTVQTQTQSKERKVLLVKDKSGNWVVFDDAKAKENNSSKEEKTSSSYFNINWGTVITVASTVIGVCLIAFQIYSGYAGSSTATDLVETFTREDVQFAIDTGGWPLR